MVVARRPKLSHYLQKTLQLIHVTQIINYHTRKQVKHLHVTF